MEDSLSLLLIQNLDDRSDIFVYKSWRNLDFHIIGIMQAIGQRKAPNPTLFKCFEDTTLIEPPDHFSIFVLWLSGLFHFKTTFFIP